MKRSLLARYERTPSGAIVIDVSAARVEDLYSNFDRSAPYIRRDLDPNLVDYLIESAEEIGNEDFVIRFALEQPPHEDQLSRIRGSVRSYFSYLTEREGQKIRHMFRTSLLLMAMGMGLFVVAIWMGGLFGEERTVFENVMAEGLTVAAWVALWEALAKFVIEWPVFRSSLACYRRLSESPLEFASRTISPVSQSHEPGEPA